MSGTGADSYLDFEEFAGIVLRSSLDNKGRGTLNAIGIYQNVARYRTQSSDPADPPAGEAVQWVSDGTGTGDEGDVLYKITDSTGTTKIITLVDFSAN